jgi:hypothetical protein
MLHSSRALLGEALVNPIHSSRSILHSRNYVLTAFELYTSSFVESLLSWHSAVSLRNHVFDGS